jgi:hypothetical protein
VNRDHGRRASAARRDDLQLKYAVGALSRREPLARDDRARWAGTNRGATTRVVDVGAPGDGGAAGVIVAERRVL